MASELKILNTAQTPPFMIEDTVDVSENIRLKHRHLDLRRPRSSRKTSSRAQGRRGRTRLSERQRLSRHRDPVLTRSTPRGPGLSGAQPGQPGQFYALPQSPQIFKQLLMISGFDRYYQIVRCFRDEDLRADRQPEFTQIDVEMSFVGEEDIMAMAEGMMRGVQKVSGPVNLPAVSAAGLRRGHGPLRAGQTRHPLRPGAVRRLRHRGRRRFQGVCQRGQKGGSSRPSTPRAASTFPQGDRRPGRLRGRLPRQGAGLDQGPRGRAGSRPSPNFSPTRKRRPGRALDMAPGDLVFFVADQPKVVNEALGHLRNHLGASAWG
jgi:aspartyl-tRNA synthetase